jgi:hypothetical protein
MGHTWVLWRFMAQKTANSPTPVRRMMVRPLMRPFGACEVLVSAIAASR